MENEIINESAESLSSKESNFGRQDNPDYCWTHRHQCKTVVSSVQSSNTSDFVSLFTDSAHENQVVACSSRKKSEKPLGINMPTELCFMESKPLVKFVDFINKIRGCKTTKV